MKTSSLIALAAFAALEFSPALQATPINFNFASTSDPTAWMVSTHVTGMDTYNDASRFLTGAGDFHAAVKVVNRGDFIANNMWGSNGGVGYYTQFVFRQTFDLTGYDPATAHLTFQWAADDTGQGFADRGHWLNRFRLNGGAFEGIDSGGYYDYDPNKVVDLSSGFVVGLNTIDFYVQGNGQTDGFELKTITATAESSTSGVPDGSSGALLTLLAIGGLAAIRHSRRFVPTRH